MSHEYHDVASTPSCGIPTKSKWGRDQYVSSWLVGVTTEITLTAAGTEAETETAMRLLLLLLLHRRGAVDERVQVRYACR